MTRLAMTLGFTTLCFACTEGSKAPELELAETPSGIQGVYTSQWGTVVFSGEQIGDDSFEFTYELNGMTIVETADRTGGVILVDGYATETGESTQLNADDRKLLSAMVFELDLLGNDVSEIVRLTKSVGSWFAEFTDSMDLQLATYFDMDRDVTCGPYGYYDWSSHGHQELVFGAGYGEDSVTVENFHVNRDGACSGADGSWFWNGSSWVCYEPEDDPNIEYGWGNCFGRCGESCGGTSAWTWDCEDHDECVRFGHMTGSLWCSAEAVSAGDDMLSGDCQH